MGPSDEGLGRSGYSWRFHPMSGLRTLGFVMGGRPSSDSGGNGGSAIVLKENYSFKKFKVWIKFEVPISLELGALLVTRRIVCLL